MRFFISTYLILISVISFANSYSGTIKDEEGAPIADVKILLVEQNETFHGNIDGSWKIETPVEKATIVFKKDGYTYEQFVNQRPSDDLCITLRKALKSSATIREEGYIQNGCNTVSIPDDKKWNVTFKQSDLKGDLAPDKKYTRRDPSAVIEVDGTYYLYYSYSLTFDSKKLAPWDLNDIYFASSKDGITWKEHGVAVGRGETGSYDHRSVFTTEIFVDNNKFYLVYQCAADENGIYMRNTVGMSVADSPAGPWKKLDEPVLHPTYTNNIYFDNTAVHDPCIVAYNGKYHLYYKGECRCRENADCKSWCNPVCGLRKQVKWGVAIADTPTGPFIKSASNPITNTGHEVMVWPYKNGMAILQHQDGPEAETIQYSKDGVNFEIMGAVHNIPEAAGLYRSSVSQNNPHKGIKWGVAHKLMWDTKPGWMYIKRFEVVK